MEQNYTIILSQESFKRISDYASFLKDGGQCGSNLSRKLLGQSKDYLSTEKLLDALLNTKYPQIFAESAILGDGTDWTLTELGLLGDVSIGMTVNIYDNGAHQNPIIHDTPFIGHLVYTPGALLRNDHDFPPADWREIITNGECDIEKYYRLYERRLLPAFQYISTKAIHRNCPAFITVPGIGCGQFAGPFRGQMGQILQTTLTRLLETHGNSLAGVKAVYYDPYGECEDDVQMINGIQFMVRPLLQNNAGKSQLCKPTALSKDSEGNFSDCELYSLVAWDHVSWPGNDYYLGDRVTDDGVKAAATSTMKVMTGIKGTYSKKQKRYLPPSIFQNWSEVVYHHDISLRVTDNLFIF